LDVPKKEFDHIIRVIRAIHKQFKFIYPRTTTFIAADITRERVDFCAFEESIQKAADRWENRFPAMGSLPPMEKLWLAGNCQRWSKWFNLPLTNGFATDIIEAIIEMKRIGRRERIENAVQHLSRRIEHLLREVFMQSAADKWGKEGWQASLKEELALPKPFREWNLGELAEACRRWSDRSTDEVLQPGELSNLQTFLDLRNAVIHTTPKKGKRSLGEYLEDEILLDISHAFGVLISLQRTAESRKEIRTESALEDPQT
jgi:hypothetical protein